MVIIFYFLYFLAVLAFIAILLELSFLVVIWTGAPYIATDKKKIADILKLAKIKKEEKVVDLGSGDGRLVIAFAKEGVEAHGYEINPFLVWWSKYKIKQAGLSKLAFIDRCNFWDRDVSKFDGVVFFASGNIMDRLETKLKKELKTSARIISNGFSFPNWVEEKKEGQLFLYKV